MRPAAFVLAFALFGGEAAAQPAIPGVESVTVNGRRVPDQEIQAFVEKRAAPTFTLGKVARWTGGICPTAMGLKSDFTQFVLQRARDRAVEIGAPVSAPDGCKSNIQIIFTTTPQQLLDDVRKNNQVPAGLSRQCRPGGRDGQGHACDSGLVLHRNGGRARSVSSR